MLNLASKIDFVVHYFCQKKQFQSIVVHETPVRNKQHGQPVTVLVAQNVPTRVLEKYNKVFSNHCRVF